MSAKQEAPPFRAREDVTAYEFCCGRHSVAARFETEHRPLPWGGRISVRAYQEGRLGKVLARHHALPAMLARAIQRSNGTVTTALVGKRFGRRLLQSTLLGSGKDRRLRKLVSEGVVVLPVDAKFKMHFAVVCMELRRSGKFDEYLHSSFQKEEFHWHSYKEERGDLAVESLMNFMREHEHLVPEEMRWVRSP